MNAVILQKADSFKMDDATIIKRVLSGEKELFEIILRRYNQKLFRVIRSYLRNDDDIQDAMQETYLKAFHKLQQFQGHAAFSTWLIRIAINEALQRLKKNKIRSIYDAGDSSSENIIQLPDNRQMNPENISIGQETKKMIERAIDALPEKYRAVYVLKEIEGLEHHEVSACLGITDSNVKVRLHRAKSLMKDSLLKLSADAQIFEFGSSRCDAMVNYVMGRI